MAKSRRVSHTSASDSGRTLANFKHQSKGKRKGVRRGGILTKSKRPGSSSKRNRRKKNKK